LGSEGLVPEFFLSSSLLSPSSAEQDMIFRLLSGILSLGNITFNEKEVCLPFSLSLSIVILAHQVSSGAAVDISEPYIISKAAEMIGVDKDRLGSILTSRVLDMSSGGSSRRGSSYRIPLDSIQAIYARDAVAKSIYKVGSCSSSLSDHATGA
jgi:myosin I